MDTTTATKDIAPTGGIRFTVASRSQRRFTALQTVSNLVANSFQPQPLTATGFLRKVTLEFSASMTCASAGAVVAGDGPWNLVAQVSLTDATGQSICQPVSGYNLYLVNKYLPGGVENDNNIHSPWQSPQAGASYGYAATATTGTASFRLDIELEQDSHTGYGCIPNLDANATPLLKCDVAAYTAAFSGTTVSAASVTMRVSQTYWAPVAKSVGDVLNQFTPGGYGDYVETRVETKTVNAASENLVEITSKGGLLKGLIFVSRAAGVRTALPTGNNFGIRFDNDAIDEGITVGEHLDQVIRATGFIGAELGTSYAPLTAGTLPGLDRGVMPVNFGWRTSGRDGWLYTRPGSFVQALITPGASATALEVVALIANAANSAAFYDAGNP